MHILEGECCQLNDIEAEDVEDVENDVEFRCLQSILAKYDYGPL